jgi:hypothetical protein
VSDARFPRQAFVALSLGGLVTFSAMFGAGASMTKVGSWLTHETDNLVTLIGAGLVFAGLFQTSRTMRDEARSRRVDQYAARLREFRTVQTNAAIMMLLNYDRDIVLREGEGPTRCCWEQTAKALIPAYFRHYLYEPPLTVIRDCFNDLLEGMSRLHFLLTQGLVQIDDVDHICRPLLTRLIADQKFAQEPLARNLRLYILWRNARGVLHLCDRYGLGIREMRDADQAALIDDLKAARYGPWEFTGWGDLDAPSSRNDWAGL